MYPLRTLTSCLITFLLAGCADQKPAPATATPAATTTTSPPVVQVTATDYAFTVQDTMPGGWVTLRLTNNGKELHHLQLIRLEQGNTMVDFAKWTSPALPDWAVAVGGPTGTPPGSSNEAIVNLAPGNYVAICVIPSADHKPHIAKGMLKSLTVVPPAQAATPPASDVAVTLTDYDFTFTKPLTSGKHVLRVETTSSQPHEIVIAKLPPGKTPPDLLTWVDNQTGPPPVESIVGSTSVNKGEVNLVPLDLAPGNYALMCFMLDAKDGKPHAVHGMMKPIKVT